MVFGENLMTHEWITLKLRVERTFGSVLLYVIILFQPLLLRPLFHIRNLLKYKSSEIYIYILFEVEVGMEINSISWKNRRLIWKAIYNDFPIFAMSIVVVGMTAAETLLKFDASKRRIQHGIHISIEDDNLWWRNDRVRIHPRSYNLRRPTPTIVYLRTWNKCGSVRRSTHEKFITFHHNGNFTFRSPGCHALLPF